MNLHAKQSHFIIHVPVDVPPSQFSLMSMLIWNNFHLLFCFVGDVCHTTLHFVSGVWLHERWGTRCALSRVKVKSAVFDSWSQSGSWFQAWSWIRTCWWKSNWDPLVWHWGLSFGWLMVSRHPHLPKKSQGLKVSDSYSSLAPLSCIPCSSYFQQYFTQRPMLLFFWYPVRTLLLWSFISPGSRLRKSGAFADCKTLCWGHQRTPGTTLNKAQSLRPASSAWNIGKEMSLKSYSS